MNRKVSQSFTNGAKNGEVHTNMTLLGGGADCFWSRVRPSDILKCDYQINLQLPGMTGRKLHRTTEVIPGLPWRSKTLLIRDLVKDTSKKGQRRTRHVTIFRMHSDMQAVSTMSL